MYEEAYETCIKYGFMGVKAVKLIRLGDYLIVKFNMAYNEDLEFICRYLFANRVYNENMLSYMLKYYYSTNENLYKLWKAASSFNLDLNEYSERVIWQMLYSGVHNGRLTEIFTDYYNKQGLKMLVKAYLSYNAYLFIVKGKKSNEIVYRVIERAIRENVHLADICYVAYLKDISRKPELLEDETKRELAQRLIDYLCEKDIIFDFYNLLTNYLRLPYNMVGSTIVECMANPSYKVMIHYILNDSSDDYKSEIMQGTDFGLFTHRFNLFFGDSLRYYFTIEGDKKFIKTDENVIEFSNLIGESNRGKFDSINDCFASYNLKDFMTLRSVMDSYLVEEYLVDAIFDMGKD